MKIHIQNNCRYYYNKCSCLVTTKKYIFDELHMYIVNGFYYFHVRKESSI